MTTEREDAVERQLQERLRVCDGLFESEAMNTLRQTAHKAFRECAALRRLCRSAADWIEADEEYDDTDRLAVVSKLKAATNGEEVPLE